MTSSNGNTASSGPGRARVQAFGHRGALGLAPENTMSGFRKALELGVDGVELDVHLTRDGQVVVLHDPELARTTDGRGMVKDLTLEQVRRFDATVRWRGRFGPEPVPTLAEVLALARGRARVAIEIKEESPRALGPALEVVRQSGMESDCSFLSFGPGLMREARALAPGMQVELIVVFPFRQVGRTLAAGANTLDLPHQLTWSWVVRRAHAAGLRVGAGIVNEPGRMRKLIAAGVDILYSDRPDLLVEIRTALG